MLAGSLAVLMGMVQVQLLPRVLPLLAARVLAPAAVARFNLVGHVWMADKINLSTVLMSVGPLVFVAYTVAELLLMVRYFGYFQRRTVTWHLSLTYGVLG